MNVFHKESGSTAVAVPGSLRLMERLLVAAMAMALLGFASLPWIWGERSQRLGTNAGSVYTGALPTYADDATTYWSWMRQSRDGRLFMTDLYTPDEHPRNYINIFFWGLGKVAAVTGLDLSLVYNLARITLGAVLMLMLYLLSARMFHRPGERLLCFFMLTFTGGWEGAAGYMERNFEWGHVTSPSWWTPEMSTFFSLMIFPHFIAGFIVMVGAVLLLLRPWTEASIPLPALYRHAAGAGACMFVLTFFHPYDVVTLMGVVWTAPVLIGVVSRRLPRLPLLASATATAVWLPAFIYNYYIFRSNPAMRAWDLQNIMITPNWDRLVIALGIAGALSLVALLALPRLRSEHVVMAAWLLSTLAIIHLPLRFQRRMIGGIQFATGVLAAAAIVWVLLPLVRRWWGRQRQGAFGWGAVIGLLLLAPLQVATPYYLEDIERNTLRRVVYPAWLLKEEYEALHALEAMQPAESVVLASYEMGNFIPPYSGQRCVIGHYALTINALEKKAAVARFFTDSGEGAGDEDAWRRSFLERWSIGYVFYSRYERALGSFDPSTRPWLERVYQAGEDPETRVAIYAFVEAADSPSSMPNP